MNGEFTVEIAVGKSEVGCEIKGLAVMNRLFTTWGLVIQFRGHRAAGLSRPRAPRAGRAWPSDSVRYGLPDRISPVPATSPRRSPTWSPRRGDLLLGGAATRSLTRPSASRNSGQRCRPAVTPLTGVVPPSVGAVPVGPPGPVSGWRAQ